MEGGLVRRTGERREHHARSGMDSGWRFPDETLYSQPVLCVVALAFTVDPGKEGLIVGAGAIGFGKQASA